MKIQQILNVLPLHMRQPIYAMNINFRHLQEIRIRVGRYMSFQYDGKEYIVNTKKDYKIKEEHMREILEYISQYSLYAYEQELKQGYITIEGGHRIGLVGKVVLEKGQVKSLKHISSINIRVAHEVIGCSDTLLPYITHNQGVCHTLLVSPPRCGKTTILRDLIRQISDGNIWSEGMTVGVVDERSELGACYQGVAQNNLGCRTDLLDSCPKLEGMMMLVRSMSPQVIVVDEIGMKEDIYALEYVLHCGCKVIASVHGSTIEDIRNKPLLKELFENQMFQRYVILSNVPKVGSIKEVYDEHGCILYENNW